MGLKWKAIDFTQKTISIQHKVIGVGGEIYAVDKLKTESSRRTLPLLPVIEELLLKRQKEIEHNKFLYGKSYDHRYDEYVFVDDTGTLINPDHVSHLFSKILKKNILKYIPFHSLRHSCASLLAANEVPIKYIQEWLGHANYNTTADVYTHLDFSTKEHSAQVINEKLTKSKVPEPESDEQLLKEIEELKKMIEEKEKQISRKNTELE